MDHILRAFYEITTRHTDLRWAKSRDDLISKNIKALRAFKEGKSLHEVLQNKEVSFEIEENLPRLFEFAKGHSEDVERLISLLGMFVKSPAPCKIKLINFVEALLENRTVPEGKGL